MSKSVLVATPLVAPSTALRSTVANGIGTEVTPDSDDETFRTAISALSFMLLSIFNANMKAEMASQFLTEDKWGDRRNGPMSSETPGPCPVTCHWAKPSHAGLNSARLLIENDKLRRH